MVADDEGMTPFNASSKFNTDWAFLQELHRLGHKAAGGWLEAHRNTIGHASSFDIESVFLKHGGSAAQSQST
jgi:NTE family protein